MLQEYDDYDDNDDDFDDDDDDDAHDNEDDEHDETSRLSARLSCPPVRLDSVASVCSILLAIHSFCSSRLWVSSVRSACFVCLSCRSVRPSRALGPSCSTVGSVGFVRSRSVCPSVPVLSSLTVHPTRSLVRCTRPVRSEYYKNNSSDRSWSNKLLAPYLPHKYPYPNNPCDFQLLQRQFYGQTYELNLMN